MASAESDEATVIYLTAEDHKVDWTHNATKELLKRYDEKIDMVDSGIIPTQRKLWELIAKDLNEAGYVCTGAQCENKWKTLKRNYRGKLEKVKKFGSCKRPCPFESEITEILSKRPHESFIKNYDVNNSNDIPEISEPDSDHFLNLNIPPGFEPDEIGTRFKSESEPRRLQIRPSHSYIVQEPTPLINELTEIKEAIIKNGRGNMNLLSKTLQQFENLAQRQAHQLILEKTKMNQQKELIDQIKLQNSLLQKLLEKLESKFDQPCPKFEYTSDHTTSEHAYCLE